MSKPSAVDAFLADAITKLAEKDAELELMSKARARAEKVAVDIATDQLERYFASDENALIKKLEKQVEDLQESLVNYGKIIDNERRVHKTAEAELTKLNQKFQEVCAYNRNLREHLEHAHVPGKCEFCP